MSCIDMARSAVFLLAVVCCVGTLNAAQYEFGTYYKLWNAQSLWNCKPVDPVFGNYTVPTSDYFPSIAAGIYSTGVFLAKATDLPATVFGRGSGGLNNVDGLDFLPNITIPRWPKDSVAATGSDGHCDIVDEATNMVHSFWQLSQNNVTLRWTASQYAWSPLNGYGWGNPSHYYQGARAAGVPTSGGVIRIHEVKDGNPIYNHALAMSMTFNGLSPNPGYIYPATSADSGYANSNKGKVPEGALVMLPPSYNTSSITSPDLRKVVETLKVYGAYVVDRNTGTPFVIYVENGSPFRMSNKTDWDNEIAAQLQRIRDGLRVVESAKYYLDGNNKVLVNPKNVNLLSMRAGTAGWDRQYGDAIVKFDTWSQSLTFSSSNRSTGCQNWSGLGLNRVDWGKVRNGRNYTIAVTATGGANLRVIFQTNQTKEGSVVDVTLVDGQNFNFTYPKNANPYMVLIGSKPGGPAGSVRGYIIDKNNDNIFGPKITSPPPSSVLSPSETSPTTSSPSDSSPSTGSPSDASPSTGSPSGVIAPGSMGCVYVPSISLIALAVIIAFIGF